MTAFRIPTNSAIAHGVRGCLIACLAAGCAADDTPSAPAATDVADNPGGERLYDPDEPRLLLARARPMVRPGSVVQIEPRLAVPTFLWTRKAPALSVAARAAITGSAEPAVAAARALVSDYATLYGLSDGDVATAIVANVDERPSGPILVKLKAELGGIEIFGEELNVVMNRDLEGIALSGYLTSAATAAARPGGLGFGLSSSAGAATALGALAKIGVDAALLAPQGAREGYETFLLSPSAGIALDDAIRVKPVYFHLPAGLEAAYYVEVYARTGAPQHHVLTGDGAGPAASSEAQAYVVSAATGQVLFRKDLIAHGAPTAHASESNALPPGGFTYRVWADPITGIPHDAPAGNAVHPKLIAAPDGAQEPFILPSDVTLPNFPYSQNDPWLAPGATETNGNNVDAFLNLFSPDGIGNPVTTTPADPPTGDYRAQITAADQFLHAQIPDNNGALAEGRQGAIQQLFYNINFLHDWYYDAGFNEAAGNAQTNNFSRGGAGNDSIRAQVQDFSGFNNANMTTGADGVRPRMRMYNFPSPANHLEVTSPAAIAGKYAIGISMSGSQTYDVSNEIVRATFSNAPTACTVTNAGALAGKIAMFDFDNTDGTGCAFTTRISRLTTTTTAPAILMVYTSATPTVIPSITGFVAANVKPVAIVPWNTGQLIKGQIAVPEVVNVRMFRAPDRDGTLDNQIVFHEWFHYASNRLVGNGAGLGTNMSAGMGEGWSDFSALLLTAREDDTATPGNDAYQGAYALATHATSGVPFNGAANHGYYFGIRRYPYSTDMTKNPLTFRHITNGVPLPIGPPVASGADGLNNAQVHNTGEVWATMLWECYAGLLRDTLGGAPRLTFQQAQDRMKQYLISALKVTPMFPTFTEARDALLAVAQAADMSDFIAFRIAFAKRGAGAAAVSPDRFSTDNAGVVEDFANGPDLAFVSATLDDSAGSCDSDGALDHGEFGAVTITLRNTGTVALSATTATVSSISTDLWYPAGSTVSFAAMAPGAFGTAILQVAYLGTVSGIQQVDLQIDFTDAQMTSGPLTAQAAFRTNTDELAGASATDSVEPVAPAWGLDFDATLGNVTPWERFEVTPLQHLWHVDNPDQGADQHLISPVMTVDGSGSLNLQFDHSWSFEFDAGGNYDGGVVEMSVNGGAFTDIGVSAYNGTILTYTGDVNPLRGRPGFVQASGGVVHTSLTQAVPPGSTVQVRFRMGADGGGAAPGWDIDDIAFTGIAETPFAIVIPDGDPCSVAPTSADLAITVDNGVSTVNTGDTVVYTITATNLGGDDLPGATVVDSFPGDLTCTWTCASAVGGICTASGAGDINDIVELPVGGSAVYTATCAVSASTSNTSLTNTATVSLPGAVSDPVPGNNAATDVDALVRLPSHVIARMEVAGTFTQASLVTYTIVLDNIGAGLQLDNPGDELVDVLPVGLDLVSATADRGTVTTSLLADDTVTWNGAIPAGGSATITIVALIAAAPGTRISNQASFTYDSQGTGTNDGSGTSDAYQCSQGGLAAARVRTIR
jgi:large repetitive protein